MEPTLHKLLIEPLLHFFQKKCCSFSLRHCFLSGAVQIDISLFQRSRKIHHSKIIVATEHIEADGMAVKLQLRLKRIKPTEFESLDALTTLAIPIETVKDNQRVPRVGWEQLNVLVDFLWRSFWAHGKGSSSSSQLVYLAQDALEGVGRLDVVILFEVLHQRLNEWCWLTCF